MAVLAFILKVKRMFLAIFSHFWAKKQGPEMLQTPDFTGVRERIRTAGLPLRSLRDGAITIEKMGLVRIARLFSSVLSSTL